MIRALRFAAVVLTLLVSWSPAGAQGLGDPSDTARTCVGAVRPPIAPSDHRTRPAADTTRHPLLTRREMGLAGAAVALTVLVAPMDNNIRATFQDDDIQGWRVVHHLASGFAFAGGPGPFVAGGALVLGGAILHRDGTATLGLHLAEAVVLAAAIDGLAKGLSGRSLPDATPRQEPGEFSLARGFHDNNGPFVSFPSGHTAAGFAMAAVLAGETARAHPRAARIVAPAVYTAAALIGVARLYQNVHWASDLPLGAAIGIWSGKTVVERTHRQGGGRLERWLRGATVAPGAHGRLAIAWSSRTLGP
jgi:membrane-associated phospholipid phosphatase